MSFDDFFVVVIVKRPILEKEPSYVPFVIISYHKGKEKGITFQLQVLILFCY